MREPIESLSRRYDRFGSSAEVGDRAGSVGCRWRSGPNPMESGPRRKNVGCWSMSGSRAAAPGLRLCAVISMGQRNTLSSTGRWNEFWWCGVFVEVSVRQRRRRRGIAARNSRIIGGLAWQPTSMFTSGIRAVRGNVGTPTGCSGSTSPRGLTCRYTRRLI